MDNYEKWLNEQIEAYVNWCLDDIARFGYPREKQWIKFANQSIRYSLEVYEECLEQYKEFKKALTTND